MVRKVLILVLLLASASFYHIVFLPRQLILVLSFGSTMFMAVAVIIGIIYGKQKGFKQNFSFEVILFLLSAVFGMFGAKWGHGQNFYLTAWIQQNMYFYFLYYFFHLTKIKPKDMERLLFIMAGSFVFLYFVQYVAYPRTILNVRADLDRGTVRIFMPGLLFAELIFYYCLNRLFKTNKLVFGALASLYLLIVVTMGTRQVYAITGFGVLMMLMFSRQVKSRAGMMLIIAAGAALIFIIFEDMFMQLIEVSQEQSAQDEDDIRVRSARFWLTDFQPMWLTYITGNGMGHQASPFGLKIQYYKSVFGYFQSDVGIIGSYSMYGILSVVGFILIIRKIFVIRIKPEYVFIKFWTVTLVFHSILGWPFFLPSGISVVMCALYLLDVSNYQLKQEAHDLKRDLLESEVDDVTNFFRKK